jgi:hypothetical protein
MAAQTGRLRRLAINGCKWMGAAAVVLLLHARMVFNTPVATHHAVPGTHVLKATATAATYAAAAAAAALLAIPLLRLLLLLLLLCGCSTASPGATC